MDVTGAPVAPGSRSVGLREVGRRAVEVYREVESTGVPVTVTDNGRPIARIVLIRREESWYQRMVRQGRVRPVKGDSHIPLDGWTLPEGLTLEALLAEDREEFVD